MEQESQEKTRRGLWGEIKHLVHDLFDIKDGLDWIGTVTAIRNKVALKGENVWMLIAATMIASVGLNTNSGAVIIGAMLISPLMSPILGIGLGVGINDRELLIKAVKNFTVATLAAIITSVVYFKFLTPFTEAGSEIISRTQPTILDALVAIFGGTAGIVAVSRKEKGAAIPGVAIATALLPPLSVAGYGLANQNWEYASKAFYLFFLNSMLIALATFLIVRYLRFPFKEHQTKEAKGRASFAIGVFVLALLVPGTLILKQLKDEQLARSEVNDYFYDKFDSDPQNLVYPATLDTRNSSDTVKVYEVNYGGEKIPDSLITVYAEELSEIEGKKVILRPFYFAKWDEERKQMNQKLSSQEQKELLYQQQISQLQTQIDSLGYEKRIFNKLEKDALALWPEIETLKFADAYERNYASDSVSKQRPVLLVKWKRIGWREKSQKKDQLRRYLDAQNALKISPT